MMTGVRTYAQNCGMARSLDLLGERWTLLIIRELARGPKRFRDLASSLEGIGSNLLSARLHSLQDAGVIRAEDLPAPAGVPGYALTDRGRALIVPLESLALWGLGIPWPGIEEARNRAVWAAMTMRANMERSDRSPPEGVYEFNVEGEAFWLRVSSGTSELLDGPAPIQPDVRVGADRAGFMRLATGASPSAGGELSVEGDRKRLRVLVRTFRFPIVPGTLGPELAGIGRRS